MHGWRDCQPKIAERPSGRAPSVERRQAGLRLQLRGAIRLAAPTWYGTQHVAPAVADFILMHGGVTIELVLTGFEPEPAPVHLVWPGTRALPKRVRALVDFLAERLGADTNGVVNCARLPAS